MLVSFFICLFSFCFVNVAQPRVTREGISQKAYGHFCEILSSLIIVGVLDPLWKVNLSSIVSPAASLEAAFLLGFCLSAADFPP